jgi:O-antigen/teichoic acid export membrane protein
MKPGSRQRYISNYSSVVLVYFISMIIPFLILMMIGRFYPVAEFGRYAIATSFMGTVAILFNLGISNTVSFEIAVIDRQAKAQIAEVLNVGSVCFAIFSLLGLLIVVAALYLLGYRPEILKIIFALAPGYWMMGLNTVWNATFLGIREMKYIVVSSLAVLMAVLLFVIPLIVLKKPLWVVALAWSLSQIAGTAVILFLIGKRGYLKRSKILKDKLSFFMRRALGIGMDNLLFRLGDNLTNILLPLYLTEEIIGVFNGAFKPFVLLVAGTQISIQFFNPYIAAVRDSDKKSKEDILSAFHKLIFFFTFSVTILPLFFAGAINHLIFGSQLSRSVPYMVILAVGYLFANSPPYSSPLKALGLEWKVILSAAAKLTLNIVGVVVLVPLFGLKGAIYAVVVSLIGYWLVNVAIYAYQKIKPISGVPNYILFLLFVLLNGWLLNRFWGEGLPVMLVFLLLNGVGGFFLYLRKTDKTRLLELIKG